MSSAPDISRFHPTFFGNRAGDFMLPLTLIPTITGNDPQEARAEGKLRVLYVDSEGPGIGPENSLDVIFTAAVRRSGSMGQAVHLIESGDFDLVLCDDDQAGAGGFGELENVCKKTATPLLHWNTRLSELEAEDRLRSVFRDALIGIYRTTPDGRILMANPALISMLGYGSLEELERRNIDLVPLYADRTRNSFLQEIDEKGTIIGTESAWRRKDGSLFYVQETARSVKGPDGKTLYYEGTVHDVTEKRLAEKALRESKEKFQGLVESIGDFIWELDGKGRIVYASPQVKRILGLEPEELMGKAPTFSMLEEDIPAMMSIYREKAANRERFTELVTRHRHKEGRIVYLETNAVPILDSKGELTGYRGIDRDVTGRVKVEKALHASNDNLNLLNSITRHDVSNQLTIINGYLDLLGTQVQGEKGTAYLAKARKATNSIRRQIEFSKDYQDMGTREARFQRVADVAQNALSGLDLGQISVAVQLDDLEVFADPMLEKVLRNLFDNTIRHGGPGVTSIRLDWHIDDGSAIISYRDDGAGISPADRHLLFLKGHGKNTGLGLFLSRAILAITSLEINELPCEEGARFDIRVPPEMFRRGPG
jgi:PAS domain S-box-containing protein